MIAPSKFVYLDDAGHPIDKPFLVIGGFISSESKWLAFEKPWKDILQARGIPFPFHATDFFSERACDPKLKHITADLVRTISNHIEAAFSVGLDLEVYKRVNREKRMEEIAGAPIAVISRALRENVDKWKKSIGDTSSTLYFMERGTYQRGDMMDCWRYIDGLDPPTPVPKEHSSAQAADLYAFSVYQSAPFLSPSWQHEMFAQKKIQHFDARIMESDLRGYLLKPSTVLVTEKYPQGVRVSIPDREATQNVNFTFKGNKNKQQNIRRAKIGLERD